MITKTDATSASYGDHFHHVSAKNADGTPQRVRVMGKCKMWKTRPLEFRLPVKRGMYETGYLDQDNADDWIPGYGS